MRKLMYVLTLIAFGAVFTSCEQEDVTPTDDIEINDSEFTVESGGEEDGDRPDHKPD